MYSGRSAAKAGKRGFGKRRTVVQLDDEPRKPPTYYGFGYTPREETPKPDTSANALSGLMSNYSVDSYSDEENADEDDDDEINNGGGGGGREGGGGEDSSSRSREKSWPKFVAATDTRLPTATETSKDEKMSSSRKADAVPSGGEVKDEIDLKLQDFLAEIESIDVVVEKTSADAAAAAAAAAAAVDGKCMSDGENGGVATSDDDLSSYPTKPKQPSTYWQYCLDEGTQCYYYWNTQTNEVTWEIPVGYSQYLLRYKDYEEKLTKYEKELTEWKKIHGNKKPKKAVKKHRKHKKKTEETKELIESLVSYPSIDEEVEEEEEKKEKKKKETLITVFGPEKPLNHDIEETTEKNGGGVERTEEGGEAIEKRSGQQSPPPPPPPPPFSASSSKMEDLFAEFDVPSPIKALEALHNEFSKKKVDIAAKVSALTRLDESKSADRKSSRSCDQKTSKSHDRNKAEVEMAEMMTSGCHGDDNETAAAAGVVVSSSSSALLPLMIDDDDDVVKDVEEEEQEEQEAFVDDEPIFSHYEYVNKRYTGDDVEPNQDIDIDTELELALEKRQSKIIDSTSLTMTSTTEKKRKLMFSSEENDGCSERKRTRTGENENIDFSSWRFVIKDDIKMKVNQLAEVCDLASTMMEKLEFLEVAQSRLSKLQILLIQAQTRLEDWKNGGLSTEYVTRRLQESNDVLQQYELNAAPPGWFCLWDRTYKRYFYSNSVTGETSWSYPDAGNETSLEGINNNNNTDYAESANYEHLSDTTEQFVTRSLPGQISPVELVETGDEVLPIPVPNDLLSLAANPPPPPPSSPPPPPSISPPPPLESPSVSSPAPTEDDFSNEEMELEEDRESQSSEKNDEMKQKQETSLQQQEQDGETVYTTEYEQEASVDTQTHGETVYATEYEQEASVDTQTHGETVYTTEYEQEASVDMQTHGETVYATEYEQEASVDMQTHGETVYATEHLHNLLPGQISAPPIMTKSTSSSQVVAGALPIAAITTPTMVVSPSEVSSNLSVEGPYDGVPIENMMTCRPIKEKKKKDKFLLVAGGLSLKKKNVSSLVEKWQKVQDDVSKEHQRHMKQSDHHSSSSSSASSSSGKGSATSKND